MKNLFRKNIIFFSIVGLFILVSGLLFQPLVAQQKIKTIAPDKSVNQNSPKINSSSLLSIINNSPWKKEIPKYIPTVTPTTTQTPTQTPTPTIEPIIEGSADNPSFIAEEERVSRQSYKNRVLPITDLSISLVKNTLKLSWSKVDEAIFYKVYRSTDPYFIPKPKDLMAFTRKTEFTDQTEGVVGNPDKNYFYVIKAVGRGGQSDVSNRVGEWNYKFSSKIYKYIAPPFTTVPYTDAKTLASFLGFQSGQILKFDPTFHFYRTYEWQGAVMNPVNENFLISADTPLAIISADNNDQVVTFTGTITNENEKTIIINEGMQLVSTSFPLEMNLYQSTLIEDGAYGHSSELYADRVWEWQENIKDWDYAWLVKGVNPEYDGKWWDSKAWSETKITLKPGVAYFYQRRGKGSFTWTMPNPKNPTLTAIPLPIQNAPTPTFIPTQTPAPTIIEQAVPTNTPTNTPTVTPTPTQITGHQVPTATPTQAVTPTPTEIISSQTPTSTLNP